MRQQAILGMYIGFCLILAGCGTTNGHVEASFRTIENGSAPDNGGAHMASGLQVLRSAAAWSDFWHMLKAAAVPRPALPAVNFTKNIVVAAVDEPHATGGYSIAITGVQTTGTVVIVQALRRSPGPSCIVAQAQEQPYHIIEAPFFSGDATMILTETMVNCDTP